MRTEMDNSVAHSPSRTATHFSPQSYGIDSLQVTSAAFVASNFLLRSDVSDAQPDPNLAEGIIRPEQFILAFDPSGRQYIGERIIFSATYRSARFDIHQAHGKADSLALAMGPLYLSLLGGNATIPAASTIRVQGYVWSNEVQIPFMYATSTSGEGRVIFNSPLAVTTGSPMEMLVKFHSTKIFMSSSGILMDPRDSRNAAEIDANLKTSLSGEVNTQIQ